ncbi:MAG: HNH endonuclease, partial [Bdellovibrionales bacterium]|nr:HNH endonuclease [Bdellovibrionales bacterium]
ERVKNKSTRECERELEKIAHENNFEVSLDKKPSKRNIGDKTLLKIYLDRDQLQLLKSRLNIHCEQELLQHLVEEKLQVTEPRTEVKPKVRKQPSQNPRSLSAAKRAIVFKKAEKKCENCGSKYFLQIDHQVSVARGGSNKVENLRVLCRSCNQRAAIEQLGLSTMDRYINGIEI